MTVAEHMTYFEAVRQAIRAEMREDPTVYLWGENVEDPYGGLMQQYVGLSGEFPGRVLDSPLAETAIAGVALGAALGGIRPIADIQIADFSFVAMEEIIRAARWRHVHGAPQGMDVPIVIKMLVGGYMGVGANHSQVPTGYWLHTPGLKIAYPSDASDGYRLMRTAIQDDDVVVFCSHKLLMFSGEEVDTTPLPFGQAAVRREGSDVTIVGIGYMTKLALQAAERLAEEGIAAEVIDPRTLEPFDLETVVRSVEKTRHLVVVDEDHLRCGAAGEICMMVLEATAAGTLASTPRRVTAPQLPMPEGVAIEQALLPSVESIAAAARQALGDKLPASTPSLPSQDPRSSRPDAPARTAT